MELLEHQQPPSTDATCRLDAERNLPWFRRRAIGKRYIPKVKPSTKETLMSPEDMLRERWLIKGLIGTGGYGEIYLATDLRQQAEEVAIKTELRTRRKKTSKRMILEQRVLLRLQGRAHVPKMVASGHDFRMNFIVMELLSLNVGELKKQSPVKRLSRTTVGRILQQAVAGLRDVHSAGYLHRDIKPANMCFGITHKTRHVLMLVDFGLVRKYKRSDGSLRPRRNKPGFRGTMRYVSLRVHNKEEQCPADDLLSLVYSGIELYVGDLPWKFLSKGEDVKKAKVELESKDPYSYLTLMPKGFQEFTMAISSLRPEDEPNYNLIQGLVADMVSDREISDPYDWENEYHECFEGVVEEHLLTQ